MNTLYILVINLAKIPSVYISIGSGDGLELNVDLEKRA